jgi:two-component system sensor histidine kinase UhpB
LAATEPPVFRIDVRVMPVRATLAASPHVTSIPVPWRDAAVIGLITAAAAVLCVRFNFSEALHRWTAPWERFQLDEIPAVLWVLVVGLAWFAARRHREAGRELQQRQAAELQLLAALADNRRLSQQGVRLQEAERKALARELHDELGQYLNVIKLDAVGLRDDASPEPAATCERARAIVDNCNHIHGALTGLIRQLRPVGLDELGLAAALEHCTDTWRARLPRTRLDLSISGEVADLAETLALTIYRLVQEALTNVAKHAAASRVAIRIMRTTLVDATQDIIIATVEDDGGGTELNATTRGLGIIGIRERVAALGGRLKVTSSPGGGFQLQAHLPVTLPMSEPPPQLA